MKQTLLVHCAACGKSFCTSREFKNHKLGGICKTEQELIAAGWKQTTNGGWRRARK